MAFQAIAYEYAVEMTHPLPEGTAVGLLNFVTMVSNLSQMTSPLYQRFVLIARIRDLCQLITNVLVSFPDGLGMRLS